MAAQVIAGAGNAGENVGYDTVIQGLAPRPFLGRVFGTIGTAAQLGAGLAYLGGGLLVSATGARTTFVISGLGSIIVLLILAIALRRRHAPTST